MTPALRAMVEAMAAELLRQSQDHRPRTPYILDEDTPNAVLIDGIVDLEKVARAGLAAIQNRVDYETDLAGAKRLPAYSNCGDATDRHFAHQIFVEMIGAVLRPN